MLSTKREDDFMSEKFIPKKFIPKSLRFLLILFLVSALFVFLVHPLFGENVVVAVIVLLTLLNILSATFLIMGRYGGVIELNNELNEQKRTREAILSLAQETMNVTSKQEMYDLMLETAVRVMNKVDTGTITVVEGDSFIFKAASGLNLDELHAIPLPIKESYLYQLTDGKMKQTVIVTSKEKQKQDLKSAVNTKIVNTEGTEEIKTAISAPIYIDDVLYGTINVDSKIENAFNEADIDLINYVAFEGGKVIKLYETLEENIRLSKYDPLTNIYNRRYFQNKMDVMIQTIKSKDTLTLVSMDLNYLKKVNDTYGHEYGDQLIVKFVEELKKRITKEDIFARFGGDEFLLALPNKNKEEAIIFMAQTKEELKKVCLFEDACDIFISFSCGCAEYSPTCNTLDALVVEADKQMYDNKREFHKKAGNDCRKR